MNRIHESYSSESKENTRVKIKHRKKTVGITLPVKLVERARSRKLNISRITEQALNSILDYLETQNSQISSDFLSAGSFQKESGGAEGATFPREVATFPSFERATTRSSAGCSPRLSYLGAKAFSVTAEFPVARTKFNSYCIISLRFSFPN